MPVAPRDGDLLTELAWDALGSSVVVRLTRGAAAGRARELVMRELDAIDRACSRFREDAELARVNGGAGRWVDVGPLLIEALGVALRAAAGTAGDVDPTVGGALVLAGYDRDWRLIADDGQPRADGVTTTAVLARNLGGWRGVEVDAARERVRVPRGVRLDLGATAKAWAADRCAAAVRSEIDCGVLVSLGGDIATAGEAPAHGWLIHVTDDHRAWAGAPGQTVSVVSGGLATSSVTTRRWRRGQAEMHHVIDPADGAPARGCWRTASVAAADCTDANIASTAALVRGASALEWLTSLGLPARLVEHGGTVHELGGWPAGAAKSAGALSG